MSPWGLCIALKFIEDEYPSTITQGLRRRLEYLLSNIGMTDSLAWFQPVAAFKIIRLAFNGKHPDWISLMCSDSICITCSLPGDGISAANVHHFMQICERRNSKLNSN